MRTYNQHTVFLLLMINFLSFVHCDYFECSEDYALDWELYGECIPKNCGRFRVLLDSKNFNIIDDIVKSIEAQVQGLQHLTVAFQTISTGLINVYLANFRQFLKSMDMRQSF